MDTTHFYKNLQAIDDFKDIAKHSSYTSIPKDWYIVASDIKDSTNAIKNGKYKDVNMVGALTIISILNINKQIDLPFVFGGDGSFLLIPPSLLNDTKQALLATKKLAKLSYSLDLRIAIISVKEIYKYHKEILITKFKISHNYSQAMIKGGGLELCDTLLKSSEKYHIKEKIDPKFHVDISGLECRWEDIPSPKDDTISLLIRANEESYYETILNDLENILGTKQNRNPISQNNTILSFKNKVLNKEASLSTQNKFLKSLLMFKFKCSNLVGKFLMDYNIGKWAQYKNRVVSTTDTEKFDDILRMVVSTTSEETKALETYLEKEYKAKRLSYGIHKSDASLMTCLIFERHGKHIHFVDSSNGGYATAFIDLKSKSHL